MGTNTTAVDWAQDGDVSRGDFSSFYEREHEGQVRRAFLLLGTEARAHDVVGDAFAAVLQRWTAIDDPGPYLNRCVLNACRDAANRAGREELRAELPEVGVRDRVDEMAGVLLDLPFRQRAAIVLRFYGQQTEVEIASALECAPGTVGSLIHRGLKALQRELTDEGENGPR